MKRLSRFYLSAVLAVAVLVFGCGGVAHEDVRAANVIATVSNAALPLVLEAYRSEQLDAVGEGTNEIATREAIIAIRHRWAPAWSAWEGYRMAFAVYATALEHDDGAAAGGALERMRGAFCAFRRELAPSMLAKLPAAPVRCP